MGRKMKAFRKWQGWKWAGKLAMWYIEQRLAMELQDRKKR